MSQSLTTSTLTAQDSLLIENTHISQTFNGTINVTSRGGSFTPFGIDTSYNFGYSVAVNDIGDFMVVGIPGYEESTYSVSYDSGIVRAYTYDYPDGWTQKGQDISALDISWGDILGTKGGTSERDRFGHQVECDSTCLLYTSPSPRDGLLSRMPSSA